MEVTAEIDFERAVERQQSST